MAESVNGKIKRFLCSDLLLERAWLSARDTRRWSRKKSPSFGHTINPLLTKLVPWRWLYIGLVNLYILMDRTLVTLAYSNKCWTLHCIFQLFRERLSEKMCTRQSRRVIWDMINTLFLTTPHTVAWTFSDNLSRNSCTQSPLSQMDYAGTCVTKGTP